MDVSVTSWDPTGKAKSANQGCNALQELPVIYNICLSLKENRHPVMTEIISSALISRVMNVSYY